MCSTCSNSGLAPQPGNPNEVTTCPDCSGGSDPRDTAAADFQEG
jgi:hypothetical protein